jgi:hypothetical protein
LSYCVKPIRDQFPTNGIAFICQIIEQEVHNDIETPPYPANGDNVG